MERVSSPPPCGKPYSSYRDEVSYTKFYFQLSTFHTAEELTHEIMVPLVKLPVMIKESYFSKCSKNHLAMFINESLSASTLLIG